MFPNQRLKTRPMPTHGCTKPCRPSSLSATPIQMKEVRYGENTHRRYHGHIKVKVKNTRTIRRANSKIPAIIHGRIMTKNPPCERGQKQPPKFFKISKTEFPKKQTGDLKIDRSNTPAKRGLTRSDKIDRSRWLMRMDPILPSAKDQTLPVHGGDRSGT